MHRKLALKIIPLLKTEEQVLSIMEKSGYDWHVCQAGIPLLKTEDQVLSIMEKSGYDSDVCQAGINVLGR
jgi:hypothetical protein